mgnify:CR=1 FL=1
MCIRDRLYIDLKKELFNLIENIFSNMVHSTFNFVAYILINTFSIFSSLLPALNEKNLPWIDVIHPIVVHFVIAMALGAVVFDFVGIIFKKPNLFEVSFLNLTVATIAIFIAIVFGQIEAGLSNPYGVSRDVLNYHSTIGWSLAGVLSVITGWRYVSRQSNPQVLSKGFVFIDVILAALVCTQVYLGDMLVWIYGLHTVPVVQAVRDGLL